MIPYKHRSLAEVFEDCQNNFDNDKNQFLQLLDETINLDEIIPFLLILIFIQEPSDTANTYYIQGLRRHLLDEFSQSLLILSSSYN